jgi:hypothetical protein
MTELQLHGISIDVPRAGHQRAVEFWSSAFGREPQVSPSYPEFAQLADVTPGCYVLIQATDDNTARMHLDYATTDRDGDLDRLAGAGATEVAREAKWGVMSDPSGQPFCLCPVTGCIE